MGGRSWVSSPSLTFISLLPSGSRPPPAFLKFGANLETVEGAIPGFFQPMAKRPERVFAGDIKAALPLASRGYQTRFPQNTQMLRDRAYGQIAERMMDLADGALLVPHQPQDLLPAGGAQNLDHGVHFIILVKTKIKSTKIKYLPRRHGDTEQPREHCGNGKNSSKLTGFAYNRAIDVRT
jgi:hypothetical protein